MQGLTGIPALLTTFPAAKIQSLARSVLPSSKIKKKKGFQPVRISSNGPNQAAETASATLTNPEQGRDAGSGSS